MSEWIRKTIIFSLSLSLSTLRFMLNLLFPDLYFNSHCTHPPSHCVPINLLHCLIVFDQRKKNHFKIDPRWNLELIFSFFASPLFLYTSLSTYMFAHTMLFSYRSQSTNYVKHNKRAEWLACACECVQRIWAEKPTERQKIATTTSWMRKHLTFSLNLHSISECVCIYSIHVRTYETNYTQCKT